MTPASADARSLVSHRTTCRLCDAPDPELVLPLAATPAADDYVSTERLKDQQPVFPLDLYLCRECGHAQLLDVVNPEALFGSYLYVTSSSPGLSEHFRRYADDVVARIRVPAGALTVDIGSNDGTLLRFFQKKGLRVLGVDAAAEIAKAATQAGVETIGAFFDTTLAERIRQDRGPASIVTANNVFAHADNLGAIAQGIERLLADDGMFVFEVSYLVDLVEGHVFDYIYHEHLCYHSVKPLQGFLRRHGLELIDVERISTKGGSLRGTAQRLDGQRSVSPSVNELIALEEGIGLYDRTTFSRLAERLDSIKGDLLDRLRQLQAQGKTIAGYGASATVTTLIYHFGLGQFLSFIVDDNVTRQGLFSPGLHIPILAPSAMYERKPDCVVILAWRFAQPILERHRPFVEAGGQFIVPLPEQKVIER